MKFIPLLFFLFGGALLNLQAQTRKLYIEFNDGISKTIDLPVLSKITFSYANMILNFTDNTTENIMRNSVKYIAFTLETGLNDAYSSNSLFVYPNPSSDYISVNVPDANNKELEIYSSVGSLVMKTRRNFF